MAADERRRLHAGQATSRPLSKDYEYIGLLGEAHFAEMTGLPLDLNHRIAGDHGIDFVAGSLTIDVKTAAIPAYLLVEKGKVFASIYVLAGYDAPSDTVRMLGWMYGDDMEACPSGIAGWTIPSHYIRRGDTNPIESLAELLGMTFHDVVYR